jgi:hypothetical protein
MLLSASYYAVVVINIISRKKKLLVRYIREKKKLAPHSEGLSFLVIVTSLFISVIELKNGRCSPLWFTGGGKAGIGWW